MGAEFEVIERYFSGATPRRDDVQLGIGDDAAIVAPAPGSEIVSVCTALHEGLDFTPGSAPSELGRRAIEAGLEALAADVDPQRPPRPAWALLGLALPEPDPNWLREFAIGLAAACRAAGVELIGGDTTRGPRTVVCVLHAIRDPGPA